MVSKFFIKKHPGFIRSKISFVSECEDEEYNIAIDNDEPDVFMLDISKSHTDIEELQVGEDVELLMNAEAVRFLRDQLSKILQENETKKRRMREAKEQVQVESSAEDGMEVGEE